MPGMSGVAATVLERRRGAVTELGRTHAHAPRSRDDMTL